MKMQVNSSCSLPNESDISLARAYKLCWMLTSTPMVTPSTIDRSDFNTSQHPIQLQESKILIQELSSSLQSFQEKLFELSIADMYISRV